MRYCPSCGRAAQPGFKFCGACGTTLPTDAPDAPDAPLADAPPAAAQASGPAVAAANVALAICSGCGIVIDASRSACETCNTPHAAPPLHELPQPGGGYWVAVRAVFTCSACGFDAPLNHFEVGEGVLCTHCGIEQRYPDSSWHDLVRFAHRVGDFGGPGPEGRFPDPRVRSRGTKPFAELGAGASWAKHERFQASPGNPLCGACKAPVVVAARRGDQLDVACSRCGDRHTYELPDKIARMSCAGALAPELQAGRREAAVVDESGVTMLRCPNCSAPLTGVKDGDGVVTCSYCRVPCRISTHTHARAGHKGTPVKTWWLYFEGPSKARGKLVADAEARAAREAEERRKAEERERFNARRRAEVAEATAREKAREKKTELKALVPLLSALALGGLVTGVILVQEKIKGDKKAEAAAAAAAALPKVDTLNRYSFTLKDPELKALFGVAPSSRMTVKFAQPAVFTQAEISNGGEGCAITLRGSRQFDGKAAVERLASLAPNKLKHSGAMDEISVAKTLLRVDSRRLGNTNGYVQVQTWVKGDRGLALADAFLAVARYATIDGPKPTAEQLEVLNGPPLAEAAKLDVSTPIDGAAKAFTAIFPYGACNTVTNLMTKKSTLTCETDVDAAAVQSVQYAWPNTEGSKLQSVVMKLASADGKRPPDALEKCLAGALGKGKSVVVDFASGQSQLEWSFGKHGRAVLDGYTFTLDVPDGTPPKQEPDWSKRHAAIVDAVARCAK